MVHRRIQLSSDQIAEFCRRHHIKRLSLFGWFYETNFGRIVTSMCWWNLSRDTHRGFPFLRSRKSYQDHRTAGRSQYPRAVLLSPLFRDQTEYEEQYVAG